MIDLYASTTPNVMKITLALNELGIAFRVVPVNVWKGEQFSDDFLGLNPNAKVPVIVDHDGPSGPVTVFESVAILVYLAEKIGRLMPQAGNARFETMQWSVWQAANLGPACGQFNHFWFYSPEGQDYARERYATELRRCYRVLETRLAAVPYLGGEEFSIADLAVFPWIWSNSNRLSELAPFVDMTSREMPAIAGWYERCMARPGVRKGVSQHQELKSMFATASPDDLDRIFGRGGYAYRKP